MQVKRILSRTLMSSPKQIYIPILMRVGTINSSHDNLWLPCSESDCYFTFSPFCSYYYLLCADNALPKANNPQPSSLTTLTTSIHPAYRYKYQALETRCSRFQRLAVISWHATQATLLGHSNRTSGHCQEQIRHPKHLSAPAASDAQQAGDLRCSMIIHA